MHCDVPLGATAEGLQVTATEVMVGAADCTVTEAVPDLDESWMLVALMVTVAAEAGAVKVPLAEILPALADQVTAAL